MWDRISWRKINYGRFYSWSAYPITLLNSLLVIILIYLYLFGIIPESSLGIIGVLIGLLSIIIAIFSLESSTIQLNNTQKDIRDVQILNLNFKGIELREQGEYSDALDVFNKAIHLGKTDPRLSIIWNNKARVFSEQRNYEEAIKAHKRAIELDQQSAFAWYNKGVTLFEWGKYLNDSSKYDEAIKTLDVAIGLDSTDLISFDVWNGKGSVLATQGKYGEAIKAYEKAIEIRPRFVMAWKNKGSILIQIKKCDEAIEAFDRAIEFMDRTTAEQGPIISGIWLDKGTAFYRKGNYEKALHSYNKSIEFYPQNVGAWINKGNTFRDQGKYIKAIQAYNKALEINPREEGVWTNKGWILFRQGKYNKAIECFDKAIQIKQDSPLAWKDKGLALLMQTNLIYNVIELNLRDAQNCNCRGIMLSMSHRYKEAIEAFDEAIEINRNYVSIWRDRPARYQEVLTVICQAINLNSSDVNNWITKGITLSKLYRYKEAIEAFDKAIELDPEHTDAWNNKAIVLAKLGRHEQAKSDRRWGWFYGVHKPF